MGKFVYDGHIKVDFDDRLLAHLQVTITTKLRRGEPFTRTIATLFLGFLGGGFCGKPTAEACNYTVDAREIRNTGPFLDGWRCLGLMGF
jgi:hypothetical protein